MVFLEEEKERTTHSITWEWWKIHKNDFRGPIWEEFEGQAEVVRPNMAGKREELASCHQGRDTEHLSFKEGEPAEA